MRRLWTLAFVAVLAACQAKPVGPALTGVTPDRGPSNRPVEIAISGERLGPLLFTDFSRTAGSALDATWTARLDREPLESVSMGSDGLIHAVVPAGFSPGTYDVVVVDPSGVTLALADAYRVVSIDSVSVLINSYRVDPVGPQQVDVPFAITVTALDSSGLVVDGYSGSVALTDLTGTAVPPNLGLFAHGAWTGQVQVSQASAADVLTVRDADGHLGASNAFAVSAGPAAALRFSTPPRVVQAGTCSQAVTVELVDSMGVPSPPSAALALTLSGMPPAGLGLFSDPACGSALTAPQLAAGQGSLTFYFHETVAGGVELRASVPALPLAMQRETVLPGPAASLAFVSAPQTLTAGACSNPLVLEVHDAFGNAAPVSAAATVALGALPAAGFSFFGAAGCGTATNQVVIGAGQATATLSMLGTTAGVVDLTASSAGLTTATQMVRINPQGFATNVAIVSAAQAVMVGSCSSPLVLQTQDSLGNPVANPGALTVTVTGLPAAGIAFFTDAACTLPGNTVALGSGQSTGVLYFQGLQPGAVTAQASSPGLLGDQQTETVLAGPPSLLSFVTAPRTAIANQCSADVVVQVQDLAGFASPVTASTTVTLGAVPGTGFGFYSNASCTAPVTSVTLLPGADTATLYFKGTVAGGVDLSGTSPGLSPAAQLATIAPGPFTQLVFTTAAQTVGAGSCSGIATVELQDAFGNTSPTAAARPVSLTAAPAAGFTFYSDPGCANAVTQVTIAGGAPSQSFYFRGLAVGQVAVTGSLAGVTPAQQTEAVVAGTPVSLTFSTVEQTRAAGTCSGAVTVQALDALGNVSPVATATAVSLAALPASGFTFYSDPACGTAAAQVTIAGGASSASFYFMGNQAAVVAVSASASGLTAAQQNETITAGPASAVVFVTPPRTVNASTCSAVLTVQLRDAFGNPSPQAAATSVTLSAVPSAGFTFFSDPGCTTSTGSLPVGVGASSADFYVSGTSNGAVVVTASSTGLTNGVQTVTVVGGATATALAFTTLPVTVVAGQCSSVLSLETQDSGGVVRAVAADTLVSLSAAPVGGLTFFSDVTCTTAASSLTITTGTSTGAFYVKGSTSGSVVVTAAATGLNPATQTETVQPGVPTHFTYTTTPQTLTAGNCSGVVTLQSLDALGNVAPPAADTTVGLSSGTGVVFYSDATCTTVVPSVTLAAAASTVSFYFHGTVAGSRTLSAQVAAWPAATQVETIVAGPPSALIFTTAARTATAGICSGTVTVQANDAYGNPATLSTPLPVALTQAGVAVTLYTGTCTTVATQVTIAAGQSSATFTFRGTVAGQVTVTATAAGVPAAQQTETVSPATPNHFTFLTTPQTLAAGACSAVVTVQALDQYNNVAPVAGNTTLTLSGNPSTGYTTSLVAGCGSTAGSVVMGAGTSQVSFYFRDTRAGTVSARIAGPGFTTGSQNETITAGPAVSFTWSTPPTTATVGVPFGMTVTAVDAFGNVAPTFVGTASLSISGGTSIACTASCTNATTTDVFTNGVWTGSLTSSGATGPGRILTATQGAITGNSTAFTIAAVNRTPPLASFTATPMVIFAGQTITFDASASSDLQTATALLQVSWDFTGAAGGPPPWSAWTTTKTSSNLYSTAGDYVVRLAVKDADGDIGYASVVVHVLPAASTNLCTVDLSTNVDDGATSCSAKGPDGKLSLVEAVRVSNTLVGKQTINFASGLTVSGTGQLNFTDSVDVVGRAGVNVVGIAPNVITAGVTVRIYNVAFSNYNSAINVSGAGTALEIYNCSFDNADGTLTNRATLLIDSSTFSRCERACIDTNGNTTVRFSLFRSGRSATLPAIGFTTCAATGPHLDLSTSVFAAMGTGVSSSCAATMLIRSNTFDANGTGVSYASGAGQVLMNNLFTSHTTAATVCGTATFTQRDYHGLLANAADGCVGADAHVLSADPQYSVAASWDYRLIFGSPAVDTGFDLGLKLTQAGPGNFLGVGPDLGGRETY